MRATHLTQGMTTICMRFGGNEVICCTNWLFICIKLFLPNSKTLNLKMTGKDLLQLVLNKKVSSSLSDTETDRNIPSSPLVRFKPTNHLPGDRTCHRYCTIACGNNMAMSSIVGSNTIMLNQREVKYVKLINYISSFTVSITLSPDFLPFKLHIQWLMSAMSICLFTSRVTRPETDIMENTIPLKYKSGKLHPNLAC